VSEAAGTLGNISLFVLSRSRRLHGPGKFIGLPDNRPALIISQAAPCVRLDTALAKPSWQGNWTSP
jgi:hypothetical protein